MGNHNNNRTNRSATAGRFCKVAMGCVLTVACLLCVGCLGRGGRAASDKGSEGVRSGVNVSLLQSVDVYDTESVDTLDFGRVKEGEVLSRTFALYNSSDRPMVVLSTRTSCGCLWLDYDKTASVSAGEKIAVEMNFDSSGYTYFVPRAFYLTTSLSEKAKKVVIVATME